jgi:hypothetical protein
MRIRIIYSRAAAGGTLGDESAVLCSFFIFFSFFPFPLLRLFHCGGNSSKIKATRGVGVGTGSFSSEKLGKLDRSTSALDSGFTHDLGFAVEIGGLEAIPFF